MIDCGGSKILAVVFCCFDYLREYFVSDAISGYWLASANVVDRRFDVVDSGRFHIVSFGLVARRVARFDVPTIHNAD